MNEEWRDIEGYEGLYQVSNLGRVKSLRDKNNKKRELILKPKTMRNGYLKVDLCKNGKQKTFTVHRLVATVFISNPKNFPVVNHKDENKLNNNISNLEWCTVLYNNCYGTRLKKVKCITTGEIFNSISKASKKYKCSPSHIVENCKGKIKSCGKLPDGKKLIWKYYKEEL